MLEGSTDTVDNALALASNWLGEHPKGCKSKFYPGLPSSAYTMKQKKTLPNG